MVEIKEINTILNCISIKNKSDREKVLAIFPNVIVFADGMYKYKLKCNKNSLKFIYKKINKNNNLYINSSGRNETISFLFEKGMKCLHNQIVKDMIDDNGKTIIKNYCIAPVNYFKYIYYISFNISNKTIEIHSS